MTQLEPLDQGDAPALGAVAAQALAALRSVKKAGKLDQVTIGGVDGMQPARAIS